MRKAFWCLMVSLLCLGVVSPWGHPVLAGDARPDESIPPSSPVVFAQAGDAGDGDEFPEGEQPLSIADPLEPLNRAFFHFNDKLYFWLLKPAAIGYRTLAPEPFRVGVRNAFYNLGFPVRFVNCLLQGKLDAAGNEFARFFTNSTVGLGGLIDVAGNKLELKRVDEDLGQSLGTYGAGPGFYINWPFLGPSSLRDSAGKFGDAFLDPLYYLDLDTSYRVGAKAMEIVNHTSLTLGDYEDFKRAAIDPYTAMRDAYHQMRRAKIED